MQGDYNFYFVQNDKYEKIEYKNSFKIKLSKEQKEDLWQMRKHRSDSISFEIDDPYKDFKAKIKEQIISEVEKSYT